MPCCTSWVPYQFISLGMPLLSVLRMLRLASVRTLYSDLTVTTSRTFNCYLQRILRRSEASRQQPYTDCGGEVTGMWQTDSHRSGLSAILAVCAESTSKIGQSLLSFYCPFTPWQSGISIFPGIEVRNLETFFQCFRNLNSIDVHQADIFDRLL